ncbi:unnamed protein product [Pedinophyceae sp. YPF-701]|nr:unnamed protein product [Pedinophyceae sp. YPF-701]
MMGVRLRVQRLNGTGNASVRVPTRMRKSGVDVASKNKQFSKTAARESAIKAESSTATYEREAATEDKSQWQSLQPALAVNSPNGSASAGGPESRPPRFLKWVANEREEVRTINYSINLGAILLFAGAAVTKMLTVDADISRGWTMYEVLTRVPKDNWLWYESCLENNPILAKATISGIVYTIGDLTAQTYEGRGLDDLDRGRVLRSGLAGFIGHGPLSHCWYLFCDSAFANLYIPPSNWLSSEANVTLAKVLVDQTAWSFTWNSIYYLLLGAMRFERPKQTLKTIGETWYTLLSAGWKLWPFAHIITYGVVPQEHRLLWVDMVEIVWVTILSFIGNQNRDGKEKDVAEAAAEVADLTAAAGGSAVALPEAAPAAATCPLPGGQNSMVEMMRGIEEESSVIFVNEEGDEVVKDLADVYEDPAPPTEKEFEEARQENVWVE